MPTSCLVSFSACSFEVLLAVQALKDTKQLVGILHIEAHSVVPNEVDKLTFDRHLPDVNHGGVAGACVFGSVGEQVVIYLLHQSRIAVNKRQIADLPLNIPVLRFVLQVSEDFFYEGTEAGNL